MGLIIPNGAGRPRLFLTQTAKKQGYVLLQQLSLFNYPILTY
jgi:hypothetical protein